MELTRQELANRIEVLEEENRRLRAELRFSPPRSEGTAVEGSDARAVRDSVRDGAEENRRASEEQLRLLNAELERAARDSYWPEIRP